MKTVTIGITFMTGILLCVCTEMCQAQAAQNLRLTPDARAQGMGRAFTAVAEGGAAQWWNPGALAMQQDRIYVNGFSYSKLVPDLADDVWWMHAGAVADAGPVGFGLHFRRLSYGESVATDTDGNRIGTFDSSEYSIFGGAGVELVQALKLPVKNIELGVGANVKRVRVDLAPAWATGNGLDGKGDVTDIDLGILGRFTMPFPEGKASFSAGWTQRNALEHGLEYDGQNRTEPIGRTDRFGLAASGEFGESPFDGPFKAPLAAATIAWDHEEPDERFPRDERIRNTGIELTGLGLLLVRFGKIDDPAGEIDGHTAGAGAHYQIPISPGHNAGISVDFAEVPQATSLDKRVQHWSLELWTDLP